MKKLKLFLISLSLITLSNFAFAMEKNPEKTNNKMEEKINCENFELTEKEKKEITDFIFKENKISNEQKEETLKDFTQKIKSLLENLKNYELSENEYYLIKLFLTINGKSTAKFLNVNITQNKNGKSGFLIKVKDEEKNEIILNKKFDEKLDNEEYEKINNEEEIKKLKELLKEKIEKLKKEQEEINNLKEKIEKLEEKQKENEKINFIKEKIKELEEKQKENEKINFVKEKIDNKEFKEDEKYEEDEESDLIYSEEEKINNEEFKEYEEAEESDLIYSKEEKLKKEMEKIKNSKTFYNNIYKNLKKAIANYPGFSYGNNFEQLNINGNIIMSKILNKIKENEDKILNINPKEEIKLYVNTPKNLANIFKINGVKLTIIKSELEGYKINEFQLIVPNYKKNYCDPTDIKEILKIYNLENFEKYKTAKNCCTFFEKNLKIPPHNSKYEYKEYLFLEQIFKQIKKNANKLKNLNPNEEIKIKVNIPKNKFERNYIYNDSEEETNANLNKKEKIKNITLNCTIKCSVKLNKKSYYINKIEFLNNDNENIKNNEHGEDEGFKKINFYERRNYFEEKKITNNPNIIKEIKNWFLANTNDFNENSAEFLKFKEAFAKEIKRNEYEISNLIDINQNPNVVYYDSYEIKCPKEINIITPIPKNLIKNKDIYALFCTISKKNNAYYITRISELKNSNSLEKYIEMEKDKNFDESQIINQQTFSKLEDEFKNLDENFNKNSSNYLKFKEAFIKKIRKNKIKISSLEKNEEENILMSLNYSNNPFEKYKADKLKFTIKKLDNEYEITKVIGLNLEYPKKLYDLKNNENKKFYDLLKSYDNNISSYFKNWFNKYIKNFDKIKNQFNSFPDIFIKEVKDNELNFLSLENEKKIAIVVPLPIKILDTEFEKEVFGGKNRILEHTMDRLQIEIKKTKEGFKIVRINPLEDWANPKKPKIFNLPKAINEKESLEEFENKNLLKNLCENFFDIFPHSKSEKLEKKDIIYKIFKSKIKSKKILDKINYNKNNKINKKIKVLELTTKKQVGTPLRKITVMAETDNKGNVKLKKEDLVVNNTGLVLKTKPFVENKIDFLNKNIKKNIQKNLEFNDSKLKYFILYLKDEEINNIKQDYENKLKENMEKIKNLKEGEKVILNLYKPENLEKHENLYLKFCQIKAIITKQKEEFNLNISPWIPNKKIREFLTYQINSEIDKNFSPVKNSLNEIVNEISEEVFKNYDSEKGINNLKKNIGKSNKFDLGVFYKSSIFLQNKNNPKETKEDCNCYYAYLIKDEIKGNCPTVLVKKIESKHSILENLKINYSNPFLNILKRGSSIKNFEFSENEQQKLLEFLNIVTNDATRKENLIKELKNKIKNSLAKYDFESQGKNNVLINFIKNLNDYNANLNENFVLKITIRISLMDIYNKNLPTTFEDNKKYLVEINTTFEELINYDEIEPYILEEKDIYMDNETKMLKPLNSNENVFIFDKRFLFNNKNFTRKQEEWLKNYLTTEYLKNKNILEIFPVLNDKILQETVNKDLNYIQNEILKKLKTIKIKDTQKEFTINFEIKKIKQKYEMKIKAVRNKEGYYFYNFVRNNKKIPIIKKIEN